MDPMHEGVLAEFLEILRRAADEENDRGTKSRILQTLPLTNPEFEASALREALSAQLEARLGEIVDEAVASKDLEFAGDGCIEASAVEEAVARLAASQTFDRLVDEARAALERAGGPLLAATASSSAAVVPTSTVDDTGRDERGFLRRNGLSGSDTDAEGMHAKKVARRDDWVDIFGAGVGGGGSGVRVDIEGALHQLEDGLGDPGSVTASVEALGILAEADAELFQFGNHWPSFLELARRALDSADPVVHAKAMTLHWVMYDKSMGMCAADMCEGVHTHARRRFSSVTHVLSGPTEYARAAAGGKNDCGGEVAANLMVVGDSELACTAREARALHGMLATIHEAFQHLPERRVWSIVSGFLSLFGNATASLEVHGGQSGSDTSVAADSSDSRRQHVELDAGADRDGVFRNVPGVDRGEEIGELTPPDRFSSSFPTILLPAHFLAVAGRVEDWLPGWLRALPTGRLVRAVDEAGLIAAMVRRCELKGRTPLYPLSRRLSVVDIACAPVTKMTTANDAASTNGAARPGSPLAPPEGSGERHVLRHRLSVGAGLSGASSSSSSGVPLNRALWLPVAELERALLVQSVSFLGIMTTHCRGALRPCPPLGPATEDSNESDGGRSAAVGSGAACSGQPAEDCLERGREVVRALVRCASRETCRTDTVTPVPRLAPRQSPGMMSPSRPSVERVTLGYIRQLATATAGGESTPFTVAALDELFSPMGDLTELVAGQDGSPAGGVRGGVDGGGRGDGGGLEGREATNPATALAALAEIAEILLSSRAAPNVFFVEGSEGPEASRALMLVIRCAAELAKISCSHAGVRNKACCGSLADVETGGKKGRALSLGSSDSRRLAVDLACALAPMMAFPPRQRTAGWRALWLCGVPQAMADLVALLDSPGCEEAVAQRGLSPDSDGDVNSAELNAPLRHRLALSLAEWARDLAGVSFLRLVGLAKTCGRVLSEELARRHLCPETRDECADPRPFALAARLALCPESFDALFSADGGMVDGVDRGLGRLGELANLAELVQSQAADISPPHRLNARRVYDTTGAVGAREEHAGTEGSERIAWAEGVGSDPADLRCLDVARRMSFSVTMLPAVDSAGRGAPPAMRWLRWAVSRSAPRAGPLDSRNCAWEEEEEDEPGASEDVRVSALGLAADMAADLTTAVEIEARWALVERLARQQSEEVAEVASGGDIEEGAGRIEKPEGRAAASSEKHDGSRNGVSDGVNILGVPRVVDPTSLARARLAISLSCLGGPNEERHVRLRSLRRAEESAGNFGVPAASVRIASGVRGSSEAIEYPPAGLSGGAWWDAAGRCVSTVVTSLTNPREPRAPEAFTLLRQAMAKNSPLLPGRGRCSMSGGSRQELVDVDDGEMGGSARTGGNDVVVGRRRSAMHRLCFSYARSSIGFAVDGDRDGFQAGLAETLSAADGAAPSSPIDPGGSTGPSGTLDCPCDWFATVAFLAAGADGAAASEMLAEAHGHTHRAIFVWPVAGERYAKAAAATLPHSTPRASLAGDHRSPSGAVVNRAAAGLPCGGGAAAAADSSRGDPPLLLLAALVEELVEEEFPCMSAALRRSGWAVAPLAVRWMRQCMLGVVDWPGVVAYLALALLRGHDYQVYFAVALMRTAQPGVMEAASRGLDLTRLLVGGEALDGFDLEASLVLMEVLERRYRSRCLEATRAYLAHEQGD